MLIKKRSQITIFIILGLVILLMVVMFLIFKSYILGETLPIKNNNDEKEQVYSYVESCLTSAAVDGAYRIASQGGYNDLPSEHFTADVQGLKISTAYVFKDDQDKQINIEDMQEQYADYIEKSIANCTGDFEPFSGYQIETQDPKATVLILENVSIIKLYYPITIHNGDSVSTISDFPGVEIPVRLGKLSNITKMLVENAIAYPDRGPNLSYLNELGKNNFNVYYGWKDKTLYYMIYDMDSSVEKGFLMLKPSISNRPFIFNIALNYD